MKNNKLQKNTGYALMFTVVIVSVVSLIAIGLSNATYKQLVLSSIARDSQTAFYMADTVVECIEYEDNVESKFPIVSAGYTASTFTCGVQSGTTNYSLTIDDIDPLPSIQIDGEDINGAYSVTLLGNSVNGRAWSTETIPCFKGVVYKAYGDLNGDTVINTQIEGSGYNICNTSNPRTVERTIKVTY